MRVAMLLVCLFAFGVLPLLSEEDWHTAIDRSMKVELEGRYTEAKAMLIEALEMSRLDPADSTRAGIVLWRLGWVCHVLGE